MTLTRSQSKNNNNNKPPNMMSQQQDDDDNNNNNMVEDDHCDDSVDDGENHQLPNNNTSVLIPPPAFVVVNHNNGQPSYPPPTTTTITQRPPPMAIVTSPFVHQSPPPPPLTSTSLVVTTDQVMQIIGQQLLLSQQNASNIRTLTQQNASNIGALTNQMKILTQQNTSSISALTNQMSRANQVMIAGFKSMNTKISETHKQTQLNTKEIASIAKQFNSPASKILNNSFLKNFFSVFCYIYNEMEKLDKKKTTQDGRCSLNDGVDPYKLKFWCTVKEIKDSSSSSKKKKMKNSLISAAENDSILFFVDCGVEAMKMVCPSFTGSVKQMFSAFMSPDNRGHFINVNWNPQKLIKINRERYCSQPTKANKKKRYCNILISAALFKSINTVVSDKHSNPLPTQAFPKDYTMIKNTYFKHSKIFFTPYGHPPFSDNNQLVLKESTLKRWKATTNKRRGKKRGRPSAKPTTTTTTTTSKNPSFSLNHITDCPPTNYDSDSDSDSDSSASDSDNDKPTSGAIKTPRYNPPAKKKIVLDDDDDDEEEK